MLALVDESATHGFSVAKVLATDGPAGQIWTVPRPLVYRALVALTEAGLVEEVGSEPGSGGPRRTLVRTTGPGHAAVDRWLDEPTEHVRDARTHLLMKLFLQDRRGRSPAELARRQRAVLAEMEVGLRMRYAASEGFDATLLRWRLSSVEMLDRFLGEIGDN